VTIPLDEIDPADPFDTMALAEEIDALHEELGQLPLLEREVLTLFYLRELTLAELADVLAVPLGTIKSRLFRARNTLRRQLETKGRKP
jgi:RNA polymerase sigma-70 factor (ECF subfamily)